MRYDTDRRRTAIAAEIRAELARKKITQKSLSAATHITKDMLRTRLAGKFPFTTDDMDSVFYALGMDGAEVWRKTNPEQVSE